MPQALPQEQYHIYSLWLFLSAAELSLCYFGRSVLRGILNWFGQHCPQVQKTSEDWSTERILRGLWVHSLSCSRFNCTKTFPVDGFRSMTEQPLRGHLLISNVEWTRGWLFAWRGQEPLEMAPQRPERKVSAPSILCSVFPPIIWRKWLQGLPWLSERLQN